MLKVVKYLIAYVFHVWEYLTWSKAKGMSQYYASMKGHEFSDVCKAEDNNKSKKS